MFCYNLAKLNLSWILKTIPFKALYNRILWKVRDYLRDFFDFCNERNSYVFIARYNGAFIEIKCWNSIFHLLAFTFFKKYDKFLWFLMSSDKKKCFVRIKKFSQSYKSNKSSYAQVCLAIHSCKSLYLYLIAVPICK